MLNVKIAMSAPFGLVPFRECHPLGGVKVEYLGEDCNGGPEFKLSAKTFIELENYLKSANLSNPYDANYLKKIIYTE